MITAGGAWVFALAMLCAAAPAWAQGGAVKIAGLVELSGPGTTSGTNFDEGAKLAVKEINAAGGIKFVADISTDQGQIALCARPRPVEPWLRAR